jgi:hypothetical protein
MFGAGEFSMLNVQYSTLKVQLSMKTGKLNNTAL